MGSYKYKRPGQYRAQELREYLAERLGFPMTKRRFQYLRSIDLIPRGDQYVILPNGKQGVHQAWSDQLAEQIITNVSASIHKGATFAQEGRPNICSTR